MKCIDHKTMGRLLLLAVVLLLTGCSDSDAPGNRKKEHLQVELRPYAPSRVEVSPVQTRAFPDDYGYVSYNDLYSNYTPQQSLVDATIHTFFISKDDGTIEQGTFSKSGNTWRSTFEMETKQFYLHGFIPDRVALDGVTDIGPLQGSYQNGITYKLNKLSSVSPADICVVVAAGSGNDNTGPDDGFALGKFDFQAKSDQNSIYLLFDHIYASLCFSFKVDEDYNKLRTIRIKKLRLLSTEMKKYVDATVTLTANTTGANPVTSVTFSGASYTETASGLLFGSEDPTKIIDPVELDDTTPSEFLGCFVPGNYNRFTLETTYDVYDKKDNRVRKDCVAENYFYLNSYLTTGTSWNRGTMLKLSLTVIPTYLYMLSEPDLDNPTVTLK